MDKKFLLLIGAILFLTCSKKEEDTPQQNGPCSNFLAPYVSNNGPVQEGQSVQLTATTNETNVTFQWTGPGNFSSTLPNPVITSISYMESGNYYVQMSNNECQANQAVTSVVVNPPCTLTDNQGTFNNLPWNFNSSITCNNSGPSSKFIIRGQSANGMLEIIFNKYDTPSGYMKYPVDNSGIQNFDSTKVQMKLTDGAAIYKATVGIVYVGNNGAGLKASFCNASFYNQNTGITWVGCKARIICP